MSSSAIFRKLLAGVALCGSVLLAACLSAQSGPTTGSNGSDAGQGGATNGTGSELSTLPLTSPNYILHPGDVIGVSIFREPDLDVRQMLDNEGVAVIPLLAEVKLAGKSVREAEDYLETLYLERDILKDPRVTVSVMQFSMKTFQVVGEVRAQGIKGFPQDKTEMDILEAIAIAGGFTEFANTGNIRIIRLNENGDEVDLTMNVKDYIGGGGRTEQERQRYLVYPGDRIYVRGRFW